MKLLVRIFNYVIMALGLAGVVCLFAFPAFSFNSNIALDVEKFSKFVPETQYTKDLKVSDALGTDQIQVAIKFSLNLGGVAKSMSGKREVINEGIVSKNVDGITTELHEPVDLITDYSVRTIIKSTIKAEIEKQIDASKNSMGSGSSAQDIMNEVGMNDNYFTNLSVTLYDSANQEGATTDSVSNTLYWQIDEAIHRAEKSGLVDSKKYTSGKIDEITNNLVKVLNDLKLVKSDGTLIHLNEISYMYLTNYLKGQLVDAGQSEAELAQKSDETLPQYADRMISTYVLTQMPDVFYKTVSGVCVGLFIGLFLFTAIWLFLFAWTFYKNFFCKKPFTWFGPWFWLIGGLQLVLGLGLTIFGKYIFPTIKMNYGQIPIKSVVFAPRTYALVPSILFLASILVAAGYLIVKLIARKQYNNQEVAQDEK